MSANVYVEHVTPNIEMRTTVAKAIRYQVIKSGVVVFDKTLQRYSKRKAQQLAREQEEAARRSS